ncbi:MAG: NAD(P)/FAD-dependent oxidoreductase [Puniceicoccales bacterium]|jgi:phytoene dehydrogenase-like protein|nr:NAD(P)/FAD-dependent oxidoreductase [Puniceicoccales bacterium]
MASFNGQHFDVVIIGAGMSGLAAGIRLAYFGRRTLVIERHGTAGGLNSFYNIGGRCFDVGLHAITNYAPPNAKGVPLSKILRQLRLRYEDLALVPQLGSAIHFAGKRIRFSNDFSLFETEIRREFPRQIDAFCALDAAVRKFCDTALDAPATSARAFVANWINDPVLADTLFLPLCYYGSARENDMDLPQFVTLWKSIFHEGFARPEGGVRRIIRALLDKYREAGGVRLMNRAVKRLRTENGRVCAVELDNGDIFTADLVFSSAGLPETFHLCGVTPDPAIAGTLAFCETITVLDKQPREDFGWGDTILFFCDTENFRYEAVRGSDLVDPTSGVICIPNNYVFTEKGALPEGWLRVTARANFAAWRTLRDAPRDATAYTTAKREWHAALNTVALRHLPQVPVGVFERSIVARDMFTPPTVERFTGRLNGAIYGTPKKSRDGRTPWQNLFLCGTDQGFLGVTGALLSGISIANLYGLIDSTR